ncbi:minichromosome maintenance protein MCM [Thermococcus sp. GR7]|uniref:AAA family ATPase n=1 Tax=unclassified Thermococcus TaxID=2627626 RepID=UPI0014302FF4|nr:MULTISPECIES: AAA family ATPase [unclassified Thermococcus]NJE46052.1 minichromosome maintenance protein MCM [Thermococcus sp. GR7]NJE79364.1 minichromosome maintenance protein MCM [Thermococcus sp. GR4]NJF22249.1 minichromosome maintenance protein MCM [Thermococcus sp. GR5]
MEVWSIKDEKENPTSEGYLTAVVGEDFPQPPPDLGGSNGTNMNSPQENKSQGDLNSQMGNQSKVDYEVLIMAIKRVVSPARNYELLPLLVLLLHNKQLTRAEIRALSEKLAKELHQHFHNYSLKSINNALSSVLNNDSIVTMIRREGNEYYMLNERVRTLILEEYSKLYLKKKEKELDSELMDLDKAVEKAVEILRSEYDERIKKLLTEDSSGILVVEYEKVLSFSGPLAELIKHKPDEALNVFSSALKSVIMEMKGEDYVKEFNVVFTSEATHKRLLDIDVSRDLNKLVTVEAKIMAISKPLIFHKKLVYVCRDCGNEMARHQDFLVPRSSEHKCDACGSRNIIIDVYQSKGVELVVFTLQDLLENLASNEQPHDFRAFTIINTKKIMKLVGQKVKITGIVRTKIQLESEKATTSEVILEVLHVQELEQKTFSKLSQEDVKRVLEFRAKYSDKEIINALIDSIAPTIYVDREKTPELWAIKKSVLIALVSSKKLVNDQRKWINVLVIGDKGSGKSRILEDLKKVFHLELASGGGSTNQVGLIGMAKNDELTKNWVYRAGALARANGSVLLIDEFDKLKEDDYKALHTVMSVGYYVFNKADLNLEVMARESIIAMANPIKGIISNQKSLFEQVAFSTTLLDRFDIIIGLRTYEEDEVMNKIDERIWQATLGEINRKVSEEVLVKYIVYAQGITPIWDESAKQKLTEFVKKLRKHLKDSGSFSYSHRLLMSMINISESIARLKLKDRVTDEDVDEAIELMTIAVKSWGEDVDFSLLSELSYDFTADQRRLLDTVEEVMERLGGYYSHGVPREELVDALQEKLGSVEDVRKAITLAMKVGIITKIGDNWMLTRDT